MRKIPEKMLQDVINYLAQKPYVETYLLIAELLKTEKIEELTTTKHD